MLRCKHVASALADHYHKDMPAWKRIGMRLHVSLCVICGKYHRDAIDLQDAVQTFLTREEDLNGRAELTLSDDAADKLRATLAEASEKSE